MTTASHLPHVLVLGASGYVGTNLVPFLAARSMTVRAAARRREALEGYAWPAVEIAAADALDPARLDRALAGIDVAYYLVHSMAAGPDFPRIDRKAAANFRDPSRRAPKPRRHWRPRRKGDRAQREQLNPAHRNGTRSLP